MKLEGKELFQSLGGRPILKGVSVQVQEGEMLGLIGPNGAGKSTLLKLMAGIFTGSSNQILLDGRPFPEYPVIDRGRKIAYLGQEGTAHWPITVERIVALGRLPHLGTWQKPTEEDHSIIQRTLRQSGLSHLASRPYPTLSGGEKARVLMARALAVEPELLLADEPVAALDPSHQLEMMDLLRRHCDQGGSVVVVLHDLRLASHYCEHLQLLLDGDTLSVGTPDQVLTTENLDRAYGIKLRSDNLSITEAFALTWEHGSSRTPGVDN
ncbi:MAG: ABC transporter ATP-binding protein [Gammaproteobacteria bacterium]|nr:ABC transporter ATP-binding protein [Gammaproteobacteria bacterium]